LQTYNQLHQGGYTELVVYFAQQVRQFERLGKEFAMQHLGSEEEMRQALIDVVASILREGDLSDPQVRDLIASLPPERRLVGISPEQRLAGLAPEQRLAGLAPEQILAGLAPEELEQLRRLLQSREDKGGPSDPR
jgi:hypothetical protein